MGKAAGAFHMNQVFGLVINSSSTCGFQVQQSNLIGFHPSCSVLQVIKLDEGEAPALTWRTAFRYRRSVLVNRSSQHHASLSLYQLGQGQDAGEKQGRVERHRKGTLGVKWDGADSDADHKKGVACSSDHPKQGMFLMYNCHSPLLKPPSISPRPSPQAGNRSVKSQLSVLCLYQPTHNTSKW